MTKLSIVLGLLAILLISTYGIAASSQGNLGCPYGTHLCYNAITQCCTICNPDPLAVNCTQKWPIDSIALLELENDLEENTENLVAEFKKSLTNQIQNDHLKGCIQVAFDLNQKFPGFLKALEEDPVGELAHLFIQLKPHVTFDNKHKSCHNSVFDAISINHIFKTLEDKLFLLYSMDYLKEYLEEIGLVKLSYLNLARVYGSLIGLVIQEYLELTKDEPVMTEEYVDYLNSIQNSWTAGLHVEFANMNRKQLKRIAGSTIFRDYHGNTGSKAAEQELWEWPSWWPFGKTNSTEEDLKANLPQNFRVGENWPGCESEIKNQLKCDGCWAFSAVGIMNDRFCIATGGKEKVDLSPQYILDCAVGASGCGGGNTDAAWRSLTLTGTPSLECIPFNGSFRSCGQDRLCADGSLKRQYYARDNYTLGTRRKMKEELIKNGSIQASFKLFDDFYAYRSGIYATTGTIGPYTPQHAIRIVGWGIDNGVEYWVVANSFGPTWGMNGYLYFKMGTADIEDFSIAGTPDLEKSKIKV